MTAGKALSEKIAGIILFVLAVFVFSLRVGAAAEEEKSASVGVIEDMYYTGYELCPEPIVICNGETLEKGTDYELIYADNVNAGTGYVIVRGISDFTDVLLAEFNILPLDIAQYADVFFECIDPEDFELSVTYNSVKVYEGSAYTAEITESKDTIRAVVTGVRNFTGTVEIESKKLHLIPFDYITMDFSGEAKYTGRSVKPVGAVILWDTPLDEANDYVLKYSHNIEAGTGTVTVIGTGDYAGKQKTLPFTIYTSDLSECTAAEQSYTYTGQPIEAIPEIRLYGYTLVKDVDYEIVSYNNNTKSGTASVTVKGINSMTGEMTVSFEIIPVHDMRYAVKCRLDAMMKGDYDVQINDYMHSYIVGNYYNTLMTSPCTCHGYCSTGYESGCTCLIGRSNVLNNNGIQCAGFTFEVFESLFGKTNGTGENTLSTYNSTDNEWTEDALKNWILETVRPGDYFAYDNVVYGYPHYVIIYDADDEGIWVYEANYGGRCKINFRQITYAEIIEQLDGIYHRTPNNYELSY